MSEHDELTNIRYSLENLWETLSKEDKAVIRANVQKVMDVALRRSEWVLHEEACAVKRLIKEQDAWLTAKRQRTPFKQWDRVQLTTKYQGYVKGATAEVELYDSTNSTCDIRIQVDHILLRGVPANKMKLR